MTRGITPHLIWALLGAASVASLWYAWSLPGGLGMFVCIGIAFILWYRLGPRGSWMALIVLGAGMGGLLAWEATTGSRCPEGDTKVFLKANKPPVGCDEIRASAGAMAAFFGMVAMIGIAAPIYARKLDQVWEEDVDDEASTLAS